MSGLLIGPGVGVSYSLGIAGGNPYRANGVEFDGTNDRLTRDVDLAGNADGKQGLLSCWFKFNGGDGVAQIICDTEGLRYRVTRLADNTFEIRGRIIGGASVLVVNTVATHIADSTWHNLLASWNLAVPGSGSIYIDDVLDYAETTFNDDLIDYTRIDHFIGGLVTDACLADFYSNTAESLDLSVISNRRKFIDAFGKPVDLGSDGSTPTGTQPIMFFSGPTVDWHTNKGSGGGFTEVGALTDCATDP